MQFLMGFLGVRAHTPARPRSPVLRTDLPKAIQAPLLPVTGYSTGAETCSGGSGGGVQALLTVAPSTVPAGNQLE